jgi:bifunctional DNA-binding transcriptional regulator/antitoxin component of YhaV-PrlF toxin-antitoxin module
MPYKLTPQNRVSVPKQIQVHLGIQPGDKIAYVSMPDGSVRMIRAEGEFKIPSPVSPISPIER